MHNSLAFIAANQMSNFELLSLLTSVASAVIALWAIIVSRRTASKQEQIAHRAQLLEARNLAATHHGKYSELLHKTRADSREEKERLAGAARQALDRLCHLFDRHGNRHDGQYTRHLFHELCEFLYEGFRPQLSWQTSLNLARRFMTIRHIDDDLSLLRERHARLGRRDRKKIDLTAEYRRDPNQLLEQLVISSASFQSLMLQLCERFNHESANQLLQEALTDVREYAQTHEEVLPALREARKRLQVGAEQNALEEFRLSESQALWSEFEFEMTQLDLLQELSLSIARHLEGIKVQSAIAELLYIGCVLFTTQMCWDWRYASVSVFGRARR